MVQVLILLLILVGSSVAQVLQPGNGGTGSSTPPTSAQLPLGDGSGVYAPQTMSGDCTISRSGVISCSSSSVGGSCDVVLNTSSDICSQINTAVSTLGSAGGRVCLPASTSLSCGTTATVNQRSISILGSGVKSTVINCTVAGDCLVLAPPLFDTTTTGDAVGGTVSDFSIIGSSAANQVLLHTKDMIGWNLHDLFFDSPSTSGKCLQMENVTAWTERNLVQAQFGYRCAQAVNMTNAAGNSYQPGSFGYNYFDFAMSPAGGNYGLYTAGSAQLYNGYLHMTVNGRGGTAVYMRGFSTGPVSTPNQRFFLNTEGSGTLFNVVPAGGKLQFVGLASIQGGGMSQGTAYYDDFYFTSPWDNSYLNSNAWNQSFAALSGINNDTGSSYALTVTGRCPGRTTGTCNFFVGTAITSGNGAQLVFHTDTTPKKGAVNIYGGASDALQWDSSGNVYLPLLLSISCLGTDSGGKIISGTCTGGSSFYQTFQANGVNQTQEAKANFSSEFALADDGANTRTNIDLSSPVSAGSCGDATHSCGLTISAKGRITGYTNNVITGGGGGGSGSMILVESHTASSSASLAFTSCISSTYDDYDIRLFNVYPATDSTDFLMDVSTDGGSTWQSSSYYWWWSYVKNGGATGSEFFNNDSSVNLAKAISSSSGVGGVSGSVRLVNPLLSSGRKIFMFDLHFTQSSFEYRNMGGAGWVNNTAVNAVRFRYSSGNVASGTIRCYGIAH